MNIVKDYRPFSLSLLARAHGRRLLGSAILIAGLCLVAITASVFPALLIDSRLDTNSISILDKSLSILVIIIILIMALLVVLFGWKIIRGRPELLLFLRRFGFADASRALTNVVAKSVGGQCRVITLDDEQVAPIGTRKIIRAVAYAIIGMFFLIILVFVIMFVGNGNYQSDYWLMTSLIALMQIFIIIFILSGAVSITLVLSFLIFGVTLSFGVWTAERKKKILISSEQEIAIVVRKISKLSKKLVGPQFLVLRVASEVWQPTVAALTDCSSAIVIDVSQPSENLLWEIRTLQAIGYRKCIFVGERLSLARVNSSRGVDRRPFDGQLRELLREQEVFEYSVEQTNWGGFARTLQYRLQDFLRTRLI